MTDTRRKNITWKLNVDSQGRVNHEDAALAVMMDIRDELQRLNTLLHCVNFQRMLQTLKRIDRRLAKRFKL